MDASVFADACVDTTGVPAGEVARLVRDRCRDWPGFGVAREQPGEAPTASGRAAGNQAHGGDGQVLLVCGPPGVGKSTIGFQLYQLYQRCLRAGLTAGYIDLDQIGFLVPRPDDDPRNHGLKAVNLAGTWQTYHAAGATHPASYLSRVAEQAAAAAQALDHTSLDALRIDTTGLTADEAADLIAAAASWPGQQASSRNPASLR
jgi:hypothetical protein